MRIFVADDSEDARDLMAATLSSGGYDDVTFAEDGLEMLARLGIAPANPSAPEADLILLDVQMPRAGGIETCARIRADARYLHTPILMVTSQNDLDTLNQAFMAGASDYINKPFNRVELHARLRSALRLKGELDRRQARERELLSSHQMQGGMRRATGGLDPATLLLTRDCVEQYAASLQPQDAAGLGVLAIRVDRMEHFRTTYGADAARQALHRIARAFGRLPGRQGDLLSHFDEGVFLAVLHGVDHAALGRAAENARQAVRELAIPHRGAGARDLVTVSVGVANNREPRALLPSAVSAMERAAGEGGDRILFV